MSRPVECITYLVAACDVIIKCDMSLLQFMSVI